MAVILSRADLSSNQLGITLTLSPASRAILIAAFAALAILVALPPPRADRSNLLRWGLGGIAGMTAMAAAPTLGIAVMILLLLVVLQTSGTGRRAYANRFRAPALAVGLLALAIALAAVQGPSWMSRLVVVCLVAGLAAALGVLPYIHEFDPDELTSTSPIPWLAFVGPVLAVVVVGRAGEMVEGVEDAFGALLIGLGLMNILVATLASWRTSSDAEAWRYSFIADWGLALCGFGLVVPDGVGGALLVFYSILLGRPSAPSTSSWQRRLPGRRRLLDSRQGSCCYARPRRCTGRWRWYWPCPSFCGCRDRFGSAARSVRPPAAS